jgi:hypothetical protein
VAIALVPAAFVVVYAFSAGGYFPGAVAWGVAALGALGLALVVRGNASLGGSRALRFAVAAAALLAAWALFSAIWSGAPWRALVEFDRVVLYALTLGVFGALSARRPLAAPAVRGLVGAIVVVCLAALLARLLPDLYPLPADFDGFGLAYPVTYANALGILAAIGVLLCLHLASDERESSTTHVVGAAAVPVLATTLALTGSGGAALAGVIGLAVYAVAARSPRLPFALLATAPTAALAVASALGASALAGAETGSPVAIAQGREVALTVLLSVANAALIGWLVRGQSLVRRRETGGGESPTALLVAAVVLALAVAGAGVLSLSNADTPRAGAPPSPGLLLGAYESRLDHWRVALEGFATAPLLGGGAGTYETLSQRERSLRAAVRDAHSLPLETFAELGAIGGLLLLAVLGLVAGGLIAGARGAQPSLSGVVLAVFVAWLFHAAIDWDWEMPVVTLPVFALCGAALGALPARGAGPTDGDRHALGSSAEVSTDSVLQDDLGPRDEPGTDAPSRSPQRAVMGGVLLALLATALTIATSERQLVRAAAAARAGDCAAAARMPQLLSALRPEPYAAVARCELRRARATRGPERRAHARRAEGALGAATERDPNELAYRDGLFQARRVARAGAAR